MNRILAIANILGILTLGAHDFLSRISVMQESQSLQCACCASCDECEPAEAGRGPEESQSCSVICDCGCFHLSAVLGIPSRLSSGSVMQFHFTEPEYSYHFEYYTRLFEPPRKA